MFGYSLSTDHWCCLRTPYWWSSWFVINGTSVEGRFLFDEQVKIEQDGMNRNFYHRRSADHRSSTRSRCFSIIMRREDLRRLYLYNKQTFDRLMWTASLNLLSSPNSSFPSFERNTMLSSLFSSFFTSSFDLLSLTDWATSLWLCCRRYPIFGMSISLVFPGYDPTNEQPVPRWLERAEEYSSPYVDYFRRLAKELNMKIGVTCLERHGTGALQPKNSLMLIDRFGEAILHYS